MVEPATAGAIRGEAFGDLSRVGYTAAESATAHRLWVPAHPPFA